MCVWVSGFDLSLSSLSLINFFEMTINDLPVCFTPFKNLFPQTFKSFCDCHESDCSITDLVL